MGVNQYLASSPKAKVLNGLYFLFNFMAWICCCVSFGGVQFTASSPGSSGQQFYWNRVHDNDSGDTIKYSDARCTSDDCSTCKGGGGGYIAMQVFAFIGLLVVITFSLIRILGLHISALEPTRKILFWELVLTGLNTFWFFLSVCIFGGTCFHAVSNISGVSITGTGFAYTIVCFLFLLGNTVLIFLIRNDSTTHLGSSGGSDYTSESDPNTTSYNPPASYQYNADNSQAAYAGNYNGDVMPQHSTAVADTNL